MVIKNNYTGNSSPQEATLIEKMDKNTMKQLQGQAKGLGITLSHFPLKHLLIQEIISVKTNQQKERAKAEVSVNAIEAMNLARKQTRTYGEADICGVHSEVIVTGKEHALERANWQNELQNRHPEIFEANPREEGKMRFGSRYGASYAIISSLEDRESSPSLLGGFHINFGDGVSPELAESLSRTSTASGLYSREMVEDFVETLNKREDKPAGLKFDFIMTAGVPECATWILYDIVTCPEDEKARVQGCFKIEAPARRGVSGGDKTRSFIDTTKINSVAMGLLTQSQNNFQRYESSWFAKAFAFKHNVLARLGLMSFATDRSAVHPVLNYMISGRSPLNIEMFRNLLIAAHGGQLSGNQLQEAKDLNWTLDHPYGIRTDMSQFKESSKTWINANKPNPKTGRINRSIWLNKDNINDLTVKSLILPFLEVAGFNRSTTTMDILAQENRTGSDPQALTNISYLLTKAKEDVEADQFHEHSDLVKAIVALDEEFLFLPYGANNGYELVSRDARRAKPQIVKTATYGKTGKNASHLQVKVEDFAGEPTICLLAVPYSEETIALRNKRSVSKSGKNKSYNYNSKKVSRKHRSK